MPRQARVLTARDLARINRPGTHAIGGVTGLCIQVSRDGHRSWLLRYRAGGRTRHLGLGACRDATLSQARTAAREARAVLRAGGDPIAQRQDRKRALAAAHAWRLTFKAAADACFAAKRPELRGRRADDWLRPLERHAMPGLGAMDVSEIGLAEVLSVIESLWVDKNPTAKLVRQRIEQVLDWATVRGHREGANVARWRNHLDQLLPDPGRIHQTQHHPALPVDEIGAFMAAVRQQEGSAARCLEFLTLTVARSGEARGARWSEIDLRERIWTIPVSRMKSGREHAVPLSTDAVALLRALPQADARLVFPAPRGGVLPDAALTAALRQLTAQGSVHGMRSTFSTWASERTAYASEVREACLAHAVGSAVERAYRRGDLLQKRRRLMEAWAAHLRDNERASVTPIREVAS